MRPLPANLQEAKLTTECWLAGLRTSQNQFEFPPLPRYRLPASLPMADNQMQAARTTYRKHPEIYDHARNSVAAYFLVFPTAQRE